MDHRELLIPDRPKHLKFFLDHVGKTEKTVIEFIEILKEWLQTQPHLPEIPSDNAMRNMLALNKFSIENTKKSIDMYYTLRSLIPEVFDKCNPKLPNMQLVTENIYLVPLPNLTEDGSRVTIFKLKDDNEYVFEYYDMIAYWINVIETRFQEDMVTTDIMIIDLENMKLAQALKITPIHFKKFLTIFENVCRNRVKKVILLHCASYAVNLINTLKTFMKEKIAQRIEFIPGIEALTDFVPAYVLPKEYGGTEMSIKKLHELWQKKLAAYQDRFDALAKLRTNESMRPNSLINDDVLGFHGNFRQPSLD